MRLALPPHAVPLSPRAIAMNEENRPGQLAIRSVGVLGGGTAGYFTAIALKRRFPHLDVTLVESSTIPIIGVGGIFSAEDAYEKISAGASLVQLYTGLIYRGPGLPHRINVGLERLLQRDGLTHLSQAVGRAAL